MIKDANLKDQTVLTTENKILGFQSEGAFIKTLSKFRKKLDDKCDVAPFETIGVDGCYSYEKEKTVKWYRLKQKLGEEIFGEYAEMFLTDKCKTETRRALELVKIARQYDFSCADIPDNITRNFLC